ncbi:hypothetical protein IEQ34_022025 [Dendrobium chrysotoxum]|uniref:Uncharacterized protein n=1 Tax=Dendrobium chrysotoxum TaxID=161865 RepID=A0AAV7FWB3_DENCH|nr:hypothetical protein IEQ34_022025 [Dendrobium chrysotoxum]
MECLEDIRVPLVVLLLDEEVESNMEISWEEFVETFMSWFVLPSAIQQMYESFFEISIKEQDGDIK